MKLAPPPAHLHLLIIQNTQYLISEFLRVQKTFMLADGKDHKEPFTRPIVIISNLHKVSHRRSNRCIFFLSSSVENIDLTLRSVQDDFFSI